MKNDMIVKKCAKCGAMVLTFKDCSCKECGIKCCFEEMKILEPNSVEASFEKHLPSYKVVGDKIIAEVGHVMEEEHYIEWIVYVSDNKQDIRYFDAGMNAVAEFDYEKGGKLYSYCNKHGLWMKEVE
ncbi:MAG: desulfoferrodoxin [Clostridia bacterium]|nr:desulfoferrodoxin [Clostridia bacterium]